MGPTIEHAGNTNTSIAAETHTTLQAITNAIVDNMDDGAFTIAS